MTAELTPSEIQKAERDRKVGSFGLDIHRLESQRLRFTGTKNPITGELSFCSRRSPEMFSEEIDVDLAQPLVEVPKIQVENTNS